MNTFKNLELIDKERINRLVRDSFYYSAYSSSELVFENMFVWNFNRQIEILWLDEDLALVRSFEKDNRWIFFPPICRTPDKFKQGLTHIKNNYPSALVGGLSKDMLAIASIEGALYLYDDYYSEYIYDPVELAEMKGGKFSRKRNLIAQFKKKYSYAFAPYTDEYLQAVKDFLYRYEQEGGAGEDFDAILYALNNREKIDLFCDLLLVEGLVVGLSIGTISVFNHAVILFEKNDFNYVGSGAVLVQLTSDARYRNCRVLTRQEDLGLPQLRKAKLAFNPIEKERKYSCFFDNATIQLYHLYLASFEDSRDYVDFFFLHYYHPERAFGVQRDGTIVSALHIIMKQMIYNNKIIDMPFIVAASTDQKYRRQGLMREVMAKTFQALIAEGQTIVSLYPVNPDFYRDYGFVQYTFTRDINSYAKSFECGLEQTSDAALLARMYDKCISEYEGYVVRDEQYYTRYMNSLWQDGYVFELIKKAGEVVGYLVRKDEDISEILLCGEEKPMHKDLDTTDTFMPHPDGDIPSNMIRVLNVEKLLLSMSFDRDTSFDLRLKITDIFVNTNNLVLDLSVQSGRLVLSRCDNYDFEVSIEALTEALFLGRGDDRLAFLFPHKKMVCFDKF